MFAGELKTMRKDETIWKHLKAIHGTQVTSLRWQRMAQGTLCEDRWKVPISVPCVGYNETKDSLVVLRGRDYNIVNNSWSVDAWGSLAGDMVGLAGSQKLERIVVELHLRQR